MRTALLKRLKVDKLMLFNAGSLAGTTAVTSVLGFVYWWIAARQFSPEAVGFASAAISAMILLGTGSILGLGTLLIGELPRQRGREASLISAALMLVGSVGGVAGIIFAIVAPFVSADFKLLGASIANVALFALGVSLTSITIVLDQACIGLLRGEIQFWRNTLFSLVKLALVLVASFWLANNAGIAIYTSWTLGNLLSLLVLPVYALLRRTKLKIDYRPRWDVLRKLGPESLKHHLLNLTLQAPTLILPVLVTVLLSVTANAWFYVAWRVAAFVFVVPTVLPTALYAVSAAQPAVLANKIRLTLALSTIACVCACCLLLLDTGQVLSLFGQDYAEQAAWSLRILSVAALPLIIKNHYIAIYRIKNQVGRTTLPMVIAGVFELGTAAWGAHLAGLSGLSLGWALAVGLEAVLMLPIVYRATFPAVVPGAIPTEEQETDGVSGPAMELNGVIDAGKPADEDDWGITAKQAAVVVTAEELAGQVTIKRYEVSAPEKLAEQDDPEKTQPFKRITQAVVVEEPTRGEQPEETQDDPEKTQPLKRKPAVAVKAAPTQQSLQEASADQAPAATAVLVQIVPADTVSVSDTSSRRRLPGIPELTWILLPSGAFILWLISLKNINIGNMNDLGLVSVFPPATIAALALLLVSFCLVLSQAKPRGAVLVLHLLLLLFMLYGVTGMLEPEPRFSVVYRHAGYTEYIARTGTVDPNLDAYFSWPGFFVLSAFMIRIAGYPSILSIAAWAPVFYNLLYLLPLSLILTTATTNKRLVWLGLCFFCLTNWIGQDYYSPQGLNLFLYLVIIAILVKWFKLPAATKQRGKKRETAHLGRLRRVARGFFLWLSMPDPLPAPVEPRQKAALLASIILIFAFSVFSHPLTPFFILASVAVLVIFRRCGPFWLPFLLASMVALWTFFMAQAFLAGHLSWVTGGFGQLKSNVSDSLGTHFALGDPQHLLIANIRLFMTIGVWLLAFLGGIWRLRKGYNDVTYVLLALTPFPLIVAQSYGGEILLRIYFFSLPMMVFFAAALFYPKDQNAHFSSRRTHVVRTMLLIVTSLALLGGFLFTRYGNERMDYMTSAEVDGVRYLYSIAQPNSIFIEGWDGTPWLYQDYEKYGTYSLTDHPAAVKNQDVQAVIHLIESTKHTSVLLIFTRSQKATADATSGLPPGSLDKLEAALLASDKFELLYKNPDVQILLYTGDAGGS